MTTKQQAAGYLQMLKAEGHLDEDALPLVQEMYGISGEESRSLLAELKSSEAYRKSASRVIWPTAATILFRLAAASFCAYLFFSGEDLGPSRVYMILYLLSALVLVRYLGKFLLEHFDIAARYPLTTHKGLPLVLLFLTLLIVAQYSLLTRSYLAIPSHWTKLDHLILTGPCIDINDTWKHRSDCYELPVAGYFNPFRWPVSNHFYQFRGVTPAQSLKKGDTISLWVAQGSNVTQSDVWDAAKSGRSLLDLAARNREAYRKQKSIRDLAGLLLVLSLVLFQFVDRSRPETGSLQGHRN